MGLGFHRGVLLPEAWHQSLSVVRTLSWRHAEAPAVSGQPASRRQVPAWLRYLAYALNPKPCLASNLCIRLVHPLQQLRHLAHQLTVVLLLPPGEHAGKGAEKKQRSKYTRRTVCLLQQICFRRISSVLLLQASRKKCAVHEQRNTRTPRGKGGRLRKQQQWKLRTI